uniref:Uncharacterized protein n=1 Tax=viral metagenome TaxID=1070528 RepID=A0A6C0C947_9ZZZZ
MFTHFAFDLKKEHRLNDDVILKYLNSFDSRYMFHRRINDQKYKSDQLQYATLFVSSKGNLKLNSNDKGCECVVAIDGIAIKNKKSASKISILVTPHNFETDQIILVGNPVDDRVHLVHFDFIKKYESCNILLCKKDSEMNFDESIVLDVSFEMFGEILNVLHGETKITDVTDEILNEMDKLGLVKAELMMMKRFVDKERNDMLLSLNSFVDGKKLMIMARSRDMYEYFKDILSPNKNVVPTQIFCVNHKKPNIDYIFGINIYDSIPIYYLATAWPDKPEEEMIIEKHNSENFDTSTWIDAKKCDNPNDVNEIIRKMLLSDYYGTFSHYGYDVLSDYVSIGIYSENSDRFIQQYVANYVNSVKIENNINVPIIPKMKRKKILNVRFTEYDVNYLSKKIRHQMINHIKFRYIDCQSVDRYYYDFPLPKKFLKNVPLVRCSHYLVNDDGWNVDVETKIYYGFINVEF